MDFKSIIKEQREELEKIESEEKIIIREIRANKVRKREIRNRKKKKSDR